MNGGLHLPGGKVTKNQIARRWTPEGSSTGLRGNRL